MTDLVLEFRTDPQGHFHNGQKPLAAAFFVSAGT